MRRDWTLSLRNPTAKAAQYPGDPHHSAESVDALIAWLVDRHGLDGLSERGAELLGWAVDAVRSVKFFEALVLAGHTRPGTRPEHARHATLWRFLLRLHGRAGPKQLDLPEPFRVLAYVTGIVEKMPPARAVETVREADEHGSAAVRLREALRECKELRRAQKAEAEALTRTQEALVAETASVDALFSEVKALRAEVVTLRAAPPPPPPPPDVATLQEQLRAALERAQAAEAECQALRRRAELAEALVHAMQARRAAARDSAGS
jgi:hypothetical protein